MRISLGFSIRYLDKIYRIVMILQDSKSCSSYKSCKSRQQLSLSLRSLLLRFVLLLDLAAIALGVVVLRVVLLHLARITTTIRMILAAFRFHLARIATA